MKDLKHLIFFENLLQEANNDLVKQAKSEGKSPIGYTCYFMPEVLLDLPGCFSVRLRAPRCVSPDIATYYLSGRVCHYARSLMERALEGGFNFLDAQMATETCTATCRFQEHLQQKHLDSVDDMRIIENDRFFCTFTDVPFKNNENGYAHYREQLRAHVLDPLRDNFGIDTSDEAIMKAIEEHNEVCRLINEIGDYRKLDNPTITGYEFHVIQLVSLTCPKYLILPYLRETLEELRLRERDPISKWRARVVVVGSELDDYAFSEILENCRCYVAADRYCFGAFPGRQRIPLNDDEDAFDQVCRFYLETNQCPRFMSEEKIVGRRELLRDLVHDFKADGIIYEQAKFCDFWGYERMLAGHIMADEYGIPTIGIDREYVVRGSGQLSTRVQAFVESLEIKSIQGKDGDGK